MGLMDDLGLGTVNLANAPAAYNPTANAGLYAAQNTGAINSGISALQTNANAIPGSVNQSASNAVTGSQDNLAQQLLGIANGTAPSAAQIQGQQQLQSGLQQSRAATQATAATNPIAALQAQQQAQGLSQRQSVGDAAAQRATESANAYSQLNSLYGNQQQTAIGQEQVGLQAQNLAQQGNEAALNGTINEAGQAQTGNIALANATQNAADSARQEYISNYQQQQANQRAFVGSLLQGAGSIGGGLISKLL